MSKLWSIIDSSLFSTDMTTWSHVVTSLEVDGFHYDTATLVKGDNVFLDLHGAWARILYPGQHYFSTQYHMPTGLSFTDCKENYKNNKNLYAMILPPSCIAYPIQPKGTLSLSNSDRWTSTDVTYVTRPAKRDQVGRKYTISQNGKFCIQYLLSGSCRMLPMKLLIDGKNFTYIALADY